MKEFNCIYELCHLEQNHALTQPQYINELIHIMPHGFSEPSKILVRINLFDKIYTSQNFKENKNFISEKIVIKDQTCGSIEVYYKDDIQFSEDEKRLLMLIKRNIESKNASLRCEEKYQVIANNTYNWEFWVGVNQKFIFNSPSCERITGYTPAEIVDHEMLNERIIHPDDRAFYRVHRHEVAERREAEIIQFRIINKSGETRYIEHVCKPVFDESGIYAGVRGTNIDITERLKIEEDIHNSEIKFKTLFFSSPVPYLIIVDGVFIECNLAAEQLFQGGRNDLIGKSPETISPEYQNGEVPSTLLAENYLRECMSNGRASFEWIHHRKDGADLLLLVDLSLIDYEGNSAILTCWKDITTERKKTEEVLKFSILADQANYGIALTDMEGNLDYVNPNLAKMHGYEVEELIGKNLTALHNEEQLHSEVFPLLGKIKTEGGFSAEEVNHVRKDGSVFPTLMSSKVIFNSVGAPKFMSATMLDISAKKKDEDEIRKLTMAIEQSPAAIIITDLESKIIYVNPHYTKITGYSKKESMGMHPRYFQSGLMSPEVIQEIAKVVSQNQSWQGDLINKRKNGEIYWEHMSVSPILNDKGKVTNYLAILTDITDRKKAEEEIKEMNHFLEVKIKERTSDLEASNIELERAKLTADEANRAKSDFLSRMSHELRTPMNSILGFAQLLEMGALDQNQALGVQHILNSGKLLLDLINEVLDISRIESGRISISIEPVEVSSVIKEVTDITMPLANSKKISVKFESENDKALYVKADRQRLKQVLLNLLNNAIKYNKPFGDVNISVKGELNENNEAKIRISIADNGYGIEEKDLQRIFHPFERVSAENSNIEGTGLGLAVVNQLMGIMHGRIGVESKVNEGSCFWIEFDEAATHHEGKKALDNFVEINATLSRNQNGNVLYIEDNPSNTDLVSQIMQTQRPGVKLITSIYGRSTMSLAIQHKPKLILLDLNLPDIHGSEVLMELKNNNDTKNIPVIILSADAMPNQIKSVMKIGAANYMTKPIDIVVLLHEVDKYLNTETNHG